MCRNLLRTKLVSRAGSSPSFMNTLSEPDANVTFFKKPKARNGARRSKVLGNEEDNDVATSSVQRRGTKRDRAGNDIATNVSTNTPDESRDRTNIVNFQADKSAVNKNVNDATREITSVNETDAERILRQKLIDEEALEDGLYHGVAASKKSLIKKRESSIKSGPIRAPANIRAISVIDYQPDVCKDYKETGFCGFGDACKFLHDRGDYLGGWQLDQRWEQQQRENANLKRKIGQSDSESEASSDDEDIPFACIICRKEYTDPVVTKCGHYYCEKCALKRYSRTSKCFACGAATGGVFTAAKKVMKRLQAKKERQKLEEGEDTEGIQLEGLEERAEDDKSEVNSDIKSSQSEGDSSDDSDSESDDAMPPVEYE